ncbi:MAG: family 20 glycosylhydrolase, partial [Bacteroidetes bacterium]|nr:family 20 glycosylhydrolase [Bacteroidota bacterium]
MKLKFLLTLLFISLFANSQQLNIIPKPVEIKQPRIAASFVLTSVTQIVSLANSADNSVNFLNNYLEQFYKLNLKKVKNSNSNNVIRLNFKMMETLPDNGYIMTVDNKGISVTSSSTTGLFYGIQTLIKLLPVNPQPETGKLQIKIPYVTITDYPGFAYRGMHLDCGRHFFPVSFIKKYIDLLALYKFNYFHWHLTEDQGWRIEIKKYPKLTQVGAWRNGTIIGRYPGTGNDSAQYGGYYTQDEIKDIVKYAAERYITIIPEIEMPGHSSAAIAAYPFLSCFPNESTYSYYPKQCVWSGDT